MHRDQGQLCIVCANLYTQANWVNGLPNENLCRTHFSKQGINFTVRSTLLILDVQDTSLIWCRAQNNWVPLFGL